MRKRIDDRGQEELEALGATFIEHPSAGECCPAVGAGPVRRRYPSELEPGDPDRHAGRPRTGLGSEDMSLVIRTDKGLRCRDRVRARGRGEYRGVRREIAGGPYTAWSGPAPVRGKRRDARVDGEKLHAAGCRSAGAHCTGIETVFRIRQLAGLTRKTAVVWCGRGIV